MARLKRFVHRLLRRPGGRRVLAGLSIGAAAFLWTLTAQGSGLPPADPHISWFEWSEHAPPVGWFIVDFIIFVWLLVKFTKKPLESTFENRHLTIKRSIAEATDRFEKADVTHKESQAKLANVDDEASQLISSGKDDGTTQKARLIEDAKAYAEKMRGDSGRLVEQESVRAVSRLQAETVLKALSKAESVLKQQLNSDDQTRLIEQAINDLESQTVVGGAA